jgi:hypothetical protein
MTFWIGLLHTRLQTLGEVDRIEWIRAGTLEFMRWISSSNSAGVQSASRQLARTTSAPLAFRCAKNVVAG